MNRRQLLTLGAVLPVASVCGRLYALPNAPGKLLVLFLRGGYDATSLLVPISTDFYYEVRPNIAIGRRGSDPASPCTREWRPRYPGWLPPPTGRRRVHR